MYKTYCCPNCLRTTTLIWEEAWCACERAVSVQPFNPDTQSLYWTEMIELDPRDLEELVGLTKARRAVQSSTRGR